MVQILLPGDGGDCEASGQSMVDLLSFLYMSRRSALPLIRPLKPVLPTLGNNGFVGSQKKKDFHITFYLISFSWREWGLNLWLFVSQICAQSLN